MNQNRNYRKETLEEKMDKQIKICEKICILLEKIHKDLKPDEEKDYIDVNFNDEEFKNLE